MLAKRSHDRQHATLPSRLAFALFVVVVPLMHWVPMLRYASGTLPGLHVTTLSELLGALLIAGAIALNRAAATELGKVRGKRC